MKHSNRAELSYFLMDVLDVFEHLEEHEAKAVLDIAQRVYAAVKAADEWTPPPEPKPAPKRRRKRA